MILMMIKHLKLTIRDTQIRGLGRRISNFSTMRHIIGVMDMKRQHNVLSASYRICETVNKVLNRENTKKD